MLRMAASASAADIAKLETKAVAAEKLIELLRQQISQVRTGQEEEEGLYNEVEMFRSKQPRPALVAE